MDRPHRNFPSSDGKIYWQGTLTLEKKVDGKFVTVATYSYGFRLHSDGSYEITPFTVVNESNQ